MTKQYKSKWRVLGIDKNKLKKIYSKNRIKANTILKRKHEKEYSIILNNLMNKEYCLISKKIEMKGGIR